MNLTINGLGGSYAPERRPPSRKRRRDPPREEAGAGPPQAEHATVRGSRLPEQSRAEIAAVTQAIQAAETAQEIVEAASEGMSGISQWLAVMLEEARHAAGLAGPDETTAARRAAHQAGLENARGHIAKLVGSVLFGRVRLLDGGLGCTGMAFGEGLEFVRGSPRTRSSSPEGYPLWMRQESTRSSALLPLNLTPELLGRSPLLAIEENGMRAVHRLGAGQDLHDAVTGLQKAAASAGLQVVVEVGPGGQVLVRHMKYGSAHAFTLHSEAPGVFSHRDGRSLPVNNGLDVAGSMNGEQATGEGQILTGCAGNRTTDGLTVRFTGRLPATGGNAPRHESLARLGITGEPEEFCEGHLVGRVILAQQPFILRLGTAESQTIAIRLNSMHPSRLGLGVETLCGFRSLADARLGNAAETESALRVIEAAVREAEQAAGRLAELRGSVLAENLARLRKEAERQQAFFTNIADPMRARQVARAVESHMQSQGRLALSAQLQPLPGAMLRLLTEDTAQAPRLGREC